MIKTRFMQRVSVFLCLILLLSVLVFSVQAEEGSSPPTSGQCGESVNWVYDPIEGTLTISGAGPMYDYSNSPWHWNQYAIKTLLVEEGVTHLGEMAFEHFGQLTAVSLPDSLESIGENAFHYCSSLETIEIPNSVTVMEPGVFSLCGNLKDVKLPKNLSVLERHSFYDCESLYSLRIPEGVTSIGDVAFYYCQSLVSITIPHTVKSLGSRPFSQCTGLRQIYFGGTETQWESLIAQGETGLPENVVIYFDAPEAHNFHDGVCDFCSGIQVVGGKCGQDLTWELNVSEGILRISGTGSMYRISDVPPWHNYRNSIIKIELPTGMTNIRAMAFENCTNVEYILLPESITTVEEAAFWNCTGLKGITVLHSKCDIHPEAWALSDPETLVIYGQPNSEVQDFVETLGYTFRPVCLCDEGRGDYEITDTEADCYRDGDRLYHCTVCDYSCRTNIVPSTGHNHSYTDLGDSHVGVCVCGDEIKAEHSYTNHVCVCGKATGIPIQHTLNLASDISLSFTVKWELLNSFDFIYMNCTVPVYEGNTQVGTRTEKVHWTTKGGYYYFTVTGLNAAQMNDVVEGTLCMVKDGVTYTCPTDYYSITQYAMTQLNKSGISTEFKTLCANLLRYGSATQIFKNYRTDNLADKDLSEEHRSYLTPLETVSFGPQYDWDTSDDTGSVSFVGKALDLQSKVAIRIIVDLSNYKGSFYDLGLRVSHVNQDGNYTDIILRNPKVYDSSRNYWVFTYDRMDAAELRHEMTLVVCRNNDPISGKVTYSMDSYGNGKTGTLLTLCQALFAYSDSAKAFFTP